MTRAHHALALALLVVLYVVGAIALYVAVADVFARGVGHDLALLKAVYFLIFAACLAGVAAVHAILARPH